MLTHLRHSKIGISQKRQSFDFSKFLFQFTFSIRLIFLEFAKIILDSESSSHKLWRSNEALEHSHCCK